MSFIYLKEQIADTFVGPPAYNSSDNNKECGVYVRNDLLILLLGYVLVGLGPNKHFAVIFQISLKLAQGRDASQIQIALILPLIRCQGLTEFYIPSFCNEREAKLLYPGEGDWTKRGTR